MSDKYDKFRPACLKQLGSMIERLRQSSHWTPNDLWLKTGVLPSAVSAVESGEDWPSDNDREKICEFVGLKVDTLSKLLAQAALKDQAVVSAQPVRAIPNVVNLKDFRRSNGERLPHKGP